jgi:uncharacterized protein YpmB
MKKLIPFWKIKNDGNYEINTNHDWYYQIQGQFHITNKKKSILAVWTGKNKLKTQVIEKKDEFGTKK